MSIKHDRPSGTLRSASDFESSIADALKDKLPSPWHLESQTRSVDVGSPIGDFRYTPDLMLRNEETGKMLVVEVKHNLSLSVANIVKFQNIGHAFEQAGADLLVVVHGDGDSAFAANARLGAYGIKAIGATSPEDAANAIERQLKSS